MPLAVTHVLLTIIIIDILRDHIIKNKKDIPLKYVFYGGIAGLLPDIDIFLAWFVGNLGFYTSNFHRIFTHSLFLPLLFLVISVSCFLMKKNKISMLFGILSFGIFFHIFLDFVFTKDMLLLFPFLKTGYGINLFEKLGLYAGEAGLDAIILLVWLWHEEKKHKISDFI